MKILEWLLKTRFFDEESPRATKKRLAENEAAHRARQQEKIALQRVDAAMSRHRSGSRTFQQKSVGIIDWLVPLVQRLQNNWLTGWVWSYWQHGTDGHVRIAIRRPSKEYVRMRLRD